MKSMSSWAWTPAGSDNTARRDLRAGRRRGGRIAGAAVTALLASTLLPGVVTPASAEVDWIGPVASNGFPAFFDDGNVKLRLCDTGPADGCRGDLTPVPPAAPEAFWFSATATGGNLVSYEAVLQATYQNGVAVPGEELVSTSS